MQTLAPTTAELLIEYNTMSVNDDATECVRAILSGDLSGPIPLKADKICGDDVTGQVFPRPFLAPKPGKLTPLQAAAEFVSTDVLRPAMCGVYHHNYTDCGQTLSVAVGTCGHTLGVFPAEAPIKTVVLHAKTFEKLKAGDKIGRFQIYENYSEKNDRYPEYQMAIPIVGKNGPAYQVTDVQGLRNILAGILRACAFIQDSFMLACIQHNSESFYFQPEFVARALRTMQATGTTRLQLELSTPNRAMVLRDVDNPEKLALVMPIMYNEGDFRPWALLLDTYAGQATVTIPAPVKRIAVKKPPVPRAVKVLSKEEEKSLAAHVKQHEAASEVGQAQMLATVREAVARHVANLGKVAFRDTVNGTGGTPLGTAQEYVTTALFLARVGRALLATIAPAVAEQPHQIGQPITHAPTISALAELVTLATAQMEPAAATTPAMVELPAILPASYYIWAGSGRYNIIDSMAARLEDGCVSKRGWDASPRGQELASAACRKLNANEWRESLAHREWTAPTADAVLLGAPVTLTSPALIESQPEAPQQNPLAFIHQGVSIYHVRKYADDPTSRILSFHFTLSPDGANSFDVRELFGNTWAMERDDVGRELRRAIEDGRLIGPADEATNLLVEHQAEEYLRTCNDEQPDELISARHGEPLPAVLTPPQMTKRKFPFTALRLAGHQVRMLHQIGKCAVAKVTTFDPEPKTYYTARYRQHTIDCARFDLIPQALELLRTMDNAEVRRDKEVLSVVEVLGQISLDPSCLGRFCHLHGLDIGKSYTRRELRRAITDLRQPKMAVYLSLLNKLAPTNPATK